MTIKSIDRIHPNNPGSSGPGVVVVSQNYLLTSRLRFISSIKRIAW